LEKPIPFGKYYLLDRISVGGMAEVFKAKAFGVEGFERLIAVKRILPSIAEDEEFITMFIDEAKIAVQLTHANIAQIFDLGKVGDSYFIAMEYVAGQDARAIFDRMRKKSQNVPVPLAAYLTMKICEGLDYAHNKKDAAGRDFNLVHRDVSPQNILVSFDGEIKIIDFGIAKAAGKAGKTQAGILKGKFGYMSPEQVRGLPLDRRSDIFAVGICLWELATGERLFVGESDFSTLEKVRNVEIVPPSSYNKRIPEELEKIILKSLSKEVEDRYQSAMDLHDDLQSWIYTSGNFFARKDLAAFMQEVFKTELEKEKATGDNARPGLSASTVPPPPRVSRTPGGGPARPGAPPPPPKVSQAPPPTPRPTIPLKPEDAVARPVPPSPNRTAPPSPSRPPVPPSPSRPAPPVPGKPSVPAGAKKTMLGMPAVQAPSVPGRPPVVPTPRPAAPAPIPPDLAQGKVAEPIKNAEIGMDDWDDDEPPTNIYDKKTAAELAKAVIAGPGIAQKTPSLPSPQAVPKPVAQRAVTMGRTQEIQVGDEHLLIQTKSKKPLYAGIAAVAAALLLVLVGVFFLLGDNTGTAELKISPADGLQVILDGTKNLPGMTSPMTVADLEEGNHKLLVKSDGYLDKEITISIKSGEVLAQPIKLEKIVSGFSIDTEPPGASIWIDDRPSDDKTPATVVGLSPGKHMVRLAKGNAFNQINFEVDVVLGKIEKLNTKVLELKEVELEFNTEPLGAKVVLISGTTRKSIGETPCKVSIETSKSYEVEYSLSGHKKVTKPINESQYSGGNEKVKLAAISLEKDTSSKTPKSSRIGKSSHKAKTKPAVAKKAGGASGKLSVQTRPWSRVSINGRFIRNTPLVNHPLKPGKYTVTLDNPGFNIRRSFRVTITSGKTTVLVKQLI